MLRNKAIKIVSRIKMLYTHLSRLTFITDMGFRWYRLTSAFFEKDVQQRLILLGAIHKLRWQVFPFFVF